MCRTRLLTIQRERSYVNAVVSLLAAILLEDSLNQRSIKKVESYLPACNVFGGIWRSFSGAAYWMVCNSCLRVASQLAKPA